MVAPQWRLQFGFHIFPKNDDCFRAPKNPQSVRIHATGPQNHLLDSRSHSMHEIYSLKGLARADLAKKKFLIFSFLCFFAWIDDFLE